MPDNFEALLGELDLLKSMPAAGEGDGEGEGEGGAAGEGEGEGAAGEGDGEGAAMEGEAFGKSFKVRLDDGTEQEAYDGTEILKAMSVRLGALTGDRDNLMKALGATTHALKSQRTELLEQRKLIKSLQDQVGKFGAQGTGRRSVLTVLEKPSTTVAENKTPSVIGRQEFMNKALTLQTKGILEARDVARCEANLNQFGKLPDDLKSLFE